MLELVAEFKLAAEPIDKQAGVYDRNIDVLHEDLAAKDFEHLCDFKHIDLDRV